jgi:hypothetical protein
MIFPKKNISPTHDFIKKTLTLPLGYKKQKIDLWTSTL